jgi:hypothetical protein
MPDEKELGSKHGFGKSIDKAEQVIQRPNLPFLP